MRDLVAVVTMVKDDLFFLRRWVDYYGGLFGREALYVVNHGGSAEVAAVAAGCSVIAMPGGYDASFNIKRASLLTHLAKGLLKFHQFVIVVDVDEFVVMDPDVRPNLRDFLARRRPGTVITPVGLEVIHRPDIEREPIGERILAVRRHARFSSFYCKPCVLGAPARLSRGGHYSSHPELRTFRGLYLLHMKYCDRGLALDTMRRRGTVIEAIVDAEGRPAPPPTQWNKTAGEEQARLDALAGYPVRKRFDLSRQVERMAASWGPRDADLFHFAREVGEELFVLPERFSAIV